MIYLFLFTHKMHNIYICICKYILIMKHAGNSLNKYNFFRWVGNKINQ